MAVAAVGIVGQALGLGAVGTAFLSIGVGVAASALIRRATSNTANQNISPTGLTTETSTQGGTQSQSIILGRYATAGHLHPAYSGGRDGEIQNAYRYRVYELADAPVNDLVGIWIDDKYFDWTSDFIQLGLVTDHRTPRTDVHDGDYHQKMWVQFYDGTQTTADPEMVTFFNSHPTRPWLNTHIGTGVPYLIIGYVYDEDLWNGEPQMLAVVDGMTIYDNRFAGLGYIQNPVTQIANIMRGIPLPQGATYGMGVPDDRMIKADWDLAANLCEQTAGIGIRQSGLEIPMASPENGGMTPWDAIDEIAKAGDIELCDMGGRWTVRAGPPAVPVATITDDDIIYTQPQELEPFLGITEKVNAVRGTYVAASARWTQSELPIVTNAADEAADGERLIQPIDMRAVSDSDQAQRLLEAWRADARRARVHKITLPPEFSDHKCLQAIAWTSERNGYTGKVFEVVEMWISSATFETTLALRERDPDDYDIGTLPPYTPPTVARSVGIAQTLPGAAVAPYSILDAANQARISAIQLSWTADAPGVRGVKYTIRNANTLAVVLRGSTVDVEAGELIISEGIIQRIDYEVQFEPIMVGRTSPSAWLPVTTGSSSLQFQDFGPSVIPASALPNNNTDNWFLDQDLKDQSVYFATTGSFTLEPTNVPESGDNLMSLQPGTTVESDWMNINELTDFRASVAVWLFPGTPGAGTARVSIQLASLAADGLITSTRTLLVGTQTDGSDTTLQSVNFRTNGSERKFRLRFIHDGTGTSLGRVGGPRVLLRNDRNLLTDEAKTEVTRATVGTANQALFLPINTWFEIGRVVVSKKTEAPVDIDVQFQYTGTNADAELRIAQGGVTIENTWTLPAATGTQNIRHDVTDDQATTGTLTYVLQARAPVNDTVTFQPRKLIATHTGT